MNRLQVEHRARVRSDNTLYGYAAVYGQRAQVRGGGWEVMARGAFDETLRRRDDVVALVDHNTSLLLGRLSNGTLRLRSDTRGLAFEVDLPDTSYAHDVREMIRRGCLRGCSFGFLPGTDTYAMSSDGRQVRTHTSVRQLIDVSVVTLPAYAGTSVGLRKPLAAVGAQRSQPRASEQLVRIEARRLLQETTSRRTTRR